MMIIEIKGDDHVIINRLYKFKINEFIQFVKDENKNKKIEFVFFGGKNVKKDSDVLHCVGQ
jgi:hypothetical protein